MNILVCNERFLFRFGADRALMILARGLHAAGHRVTMMANRYDRSVLETFASHIIDVPSDQSAYNDLNEFTAWWLENTWSQQFNSDTEPDVALVGGWPFFEAIPLLRARAKAVIFLDCGAVPIDGYGEGVRVTLEKLSQLRRKNLSSCSLIAGISDFIARSQSIPDSLGVSPVRTVYCGADHMEMDLWASDVSTPGSHVRGLSLLHSLRQERRPVVLLLGRWEPGCYKNSDCAFELIRRLRVGAPNCALLVLADPAQIDIPRELQATVYPISFPDDRDLNEIMRNVDVAVSVSLWEGFNLPLAEMQWLGKPALALNLAAHPEVILHPWFLCSDIAEMARKASDILDRRGLDERAYEEALQEFRKRFTWDRAVQEFNDIVSSFRAPKPLSASASREKREFSGTLILDVTNACKDPANTGVIRVTRRIGRTLQSFVDPIFVIWDDISNRYVLPTRDEFDQLAQFNGPISAKVKCFSSGHDRRTGLDELLIEARGEQGWILCGETVSAARLPFIRQYARSRKLRLAATFYDAIPVLCPELCNDEMRNNHAAYMRGLASYDVVVPISNYSATCLRDFWNELGIAGCEVIPNILPGEFGGAPRILHPTQGLDDQIQILCVSTLEPRKNHRRLIQACLRMEKKHPELDWSLTLVGNRYAGATELTEWIEDVCSRNKRIRWLGIVSDAELQRLYQEASFTVYPSIIEGFGMPIMESIWNGRPCLTSSEGVMSELASDGGCVTANVQDEEALEAAIFELASDRDKRNRLTNEAVNRSIKSWNDYGLALMNILGSLPPPSQRRSLTAPGHALTAPDWRQLLYPNCFLDRWQMNESERMALTGLLGRIRPTCSLEVGTYFGGSTSLITQYSKMTFSVDIDPEIPERLRELKDVRYLTGRSIDIVPDLLNELQNEGVPVEFILIDADHSAEGVKQDINWLLDYVPMKPVFVALHDSFNPHCRRGMLESNWERSPYCHFIDLDFVPGRLIEHGGLGSGELWGGLALAYFLPTRRQGPLEIIRSAERLFQTVLSASERVAKV